MSSASSQLPGLPDMVPLRPYIKLVAVHLGAGHSLNVNAHKKIAKDACEKLMRDCLKSNTVPYCSNQRDHVDPETSPITCYCPSRECSREVNNSWFSAETAVVQVIKYLEDNINLNCGIGSNLSFDGNIQCDASMMSDQTYRWAGVGALPECGNPIVLVKSIADHLTVQRPLMLIAPNLLVGSGAVVWMEQHCPGLKTTRDKLVPDKTAMTYTKMKARYRNSLRMIEEEQSGTRRSRKSPKKKDASTDSATTEPTTSQPAAAEESKSIDESSLDKEDLEEIHDLVRLDTVGAVVVDWDNNFASAVSSGGLILKTEGRVGQAAVPGAGCWVSDSVAATTTGVGEYLTQSLFAKSFCDNVIRKRHLSQINSKLSMDADLSDTVYTAIDETYDELMRLPGLGHVPKFERFAGILAVVGPNFKDSPGQRFNKDDLYLAWAHNTNLLCVGYMTALDTEAKAEMSGLMIDRTDGRHHSNIVKLNLP